jgi:hypothetical protein
MILRGAQSIKVWEPLSYVKAGTFFTTRVTHEYLTAETEMARYKRITAAFHNPRLTMCFARLEDMFCNNVSFCVIKNGYLILKHGSQYLTSGLPFAMRNCSS